jgi:uncharacterized membrane protein
LTVTGAEALYSTVSTLTLSFIVFTFASLLVAIQVAGGQYTPRIIATTLLRDNVIRYSVGVFVFTLLFAVKAAGRMEATVHQLLAFITAVLGLICIIVFLYLIDHAAKMLRPVSLAKRLGEDGLAVIDSLYPDQFADTPSITSSPQSFTAAARTIPHPGKSGIVIAVNTKRLVAEAQKANGVIKFVPSVGDLVGSGEPLFHCMVAPTLSTSTSCGRPLSSAPSAPLNRTLCLRFEFWSISRSRHYPRRSMTRPPPSSRSISFTAFAQSRET